MKDSLLLRAGNVTLCFLAFTLPFQLYLPIRLFPLSTAYPLIALLGLWVVLHAVVVPQERFLLPLPAIPFGLLVLLTITSLIVAGDRLVGVMSIIQVAMYFVLFCSVPNVIRQSRDIFSVLWAILLGYLVSSTIGVLQAIIGIFDPDFVTRIFFGTPLASLTLGSRGLERLLQQDPATLFRGSSLEGVGQLFRSFGFFGGPTAFGWFTVTGFALAAGLFLTFPSRYKAMRRLAMLSATMSLMAVFLSWTRSAWIAAVLGAVFVISFQKERNATVFSLRWVQFTGIFLLAVLLALAMAFVLPDSSLARMVRSSIGLEFVSSNAGRLETIEIALKYVFENPLVGAGFRNYAYAATQGEIIASQQATEATAHNTYLELAMELGLPGLLVFIWLLRSLYQDARRLIVFPVHSQTHSIGVACAAVWITYAFLCLFSGSIVDPKWMPMLWLIAGLQSATLYLSHHVPVQPVSLAVVYHQFSRS